MPLEFQGDARPLTEEGMGSVTDKLSLKPAEIWAVLAVETSGCGFLPDRRPQILFERHVFHHLTNGKYDDGDISDPQQGGYGAGGGHQYERLGRAMMKDRDAALQSCSWGIAQIMGEHFSILGFAGVEQMVAACVSSEDEQLNIMATFLKANTLTGALRRHDWESFARRYNGPNYKTNQYDTRLRSEFRKYSAGALPDLTVRTAQVYLTFLGFHPGRIDGVAGRITLSAYADFCQQKNVAFNNRVNAETIAQLQAALDSLGK